jgi:hypothetical protein
LEIGRGGHLALFAVGALPGLCEAHCPITPQERNLDFRIVQERRAVELRRYGTPDSAPPVCVLQLGCQLRDAKPVSVAYTLRRDSILLGDIAAMQFSYGDGSNQSCRVTDMRVPQ